MFRNSQRNLLPTLLRLKKSSLSRELQPAFKPKGEDFCRQFGSAIGKYFRFGPRAAAQQQPVCVRHQMSSAAGDKGQRSDEKDLVTEASLPNESWSEKTLQVYNEYMDLCKEGKWETMKSFPNFYTRKERLFVRAIDDPGKQFEYALFLNREEKSAGAVIQFGPWLQGPKGAVHGGAIATILDAFTGALCYNLGYLCATLNLTVDFHGFLPLYTTARCNARITKIEGKKICTSAELVSVDGKHVFSKCTAFLIAMGSKDEDIVKEQIKSHKPDSKY